VYQLCHISCVSGQLMFPTIQSSLFTIHYVVSRAQLMISAYSNSSSIKILSLLHRNGARINQYFRSIIRRAAGHSSGGRIVAFAANSGPVTLPRMVEGAMRTSGLFRVRFTLPDVGFVNTYNLPSCSANHTGVLTGTPFLRNVVSKMYFWFLSSAGIVLDMKPFYRVGRGLPSFLISGSNSSRVTHIAQHHAGVLQASHAQVDA